MTTAPQPKLVMLRARLTDAEHHALRVLSAQVRRPVADLTADALRAAYPLTEGTK